MDEFIQVEDNTVLVPTSFQQFKVEIDNDIEYFKSNKNNFIKHIWYVISKLYVIWIFT